MSEVAKAAGVSVMTVSNVVNGHRYVSNATRARVMEAIEHLGYRVNVAARNLRSGNTGIIGLAVPQIDAQYYGMLAALLIERAERLGYQMVVEQTGATRETELGVLARSRVRQYDGLILSAVGLGRDDTEALSADIPLVALGERMTAARSVDHVVMANVEGSRDATRHLIDRGCQRIAAFGASPGRGVDTRTLRTAGYRKALAEAGLRRRRELEIDCGYAMADGAAAAAALVASGVEFDGAVCFTDTIAIGVVRGLTDAGVSVPGDVLVIGFDDVEQSAFTVPSLSTVAPGHAEMADAALRMLTERIAGRRQGVYEEFVGPHRLVVRESSTPR